MIGLVNGSPKATGSNSGLIIDILKGMLDKNLETVTVPTFKWDDSAFQKLSQCDTIVAVFPLYVDGLPSHFLRFLIQLEEYVKARENQKTYLYVVAQCGFYEGAQNRLAIEMMKNFCRRAGFAWRGGIGLGGAGCIQAPIEAWRKPLLKILNEFCGSIEAHVPYDKEKYASVGIPRWLYRIAGNLSWVSEAKKYHLRRKDLYRKVLDIPGKIR